MRRIRLGVGIALACVLVAVVGASAAPIGLVALDAAYTQNFDTLASSGTANTAVPNGWAFVESGTNANGTYAAGDGSSNSGNTYSLGTGTASDRAFGGLQSGSLVATIGAGFLNSTGRTLTGLDIAYTGEQWRLGTSGRGADRLDFQISTDATSLTTGTWTDVDALDFSSPVTVGTVGKLDGNAAANRTPISASVGGITIPRNATFWIRWTDFNATSSDDALAVDDFSLTPHSAANLPVNVVCGADVSTTQGFAASKTITASDGDGLVTSLDVASVTPTPSAGSIARTSFSPATADGGTATATVSIPADVAPGTYTVAMRAANDDATPQTGTCSFDVIVNPVLRVGDVQGPGTASPHVGHTVVVRGVVTQLSLDQTSVSSGSNPQWGFFLQDAPDAADGNVATSDGVFVFLGRFTTLIGGYAPTVGDEILMQGSVTEFNGLTELSSARGLEVLRHNVAVDPFVADPPSDAAAAAAYWESHEGMQAAIPAGSIVDSPRHVYANPVNSEFYAIAPTAPVAQRSDPFAQRAFRDAHPLDDLPGLFDNGNPYKILVTDSGLRAAANDRFVFVPAVHTFQKFTAPAVGAVDYSFAKYSIDVNAVQVGGGVDPATNAPPAVFDRTKAYSIANFNMENLYDYRDDPFDGCDFATNTGCPGVNPPFDYVPASDAEYQARLTELANQVKDDLHSPDVILVAEAEDQDICTVDAGSLVCGTENNADGKPDTVQELATRIASLGGPAYDAAFDRNGADARGIVSAFLYRTDRVQLLPAFTGPAVDYPTAPAAYNADVSNPKALNAALPADALPGADGTNVFTRAAQLAHFRIWRTATGLSTYTDVWTVANHFSSGPDGRVAQRTQQAAYNAAIAKAVLAAEPNAKVMVAGDLNVYPRPDDPFNPPSDQLRALYEDANLSNLFDTLVEQHTSSAYSYVFSGQAQDLDQQFVSQGFFTRLKAVNVAHINADWTPDVPNDGNRGTSDHDPMVSRYADPVTLAGLRQLLAYYVDAGLVGSKAEAKLTNKLDLAASHLAKGQQNPYENQLASFAQDATHGTPGEVDTAAGKALAAEANALIAS